MNFKWFDNGMRVPIPSEFWAERLRVERIQRVSKVHKIPGPGLEKNISPQKEHLTREEEAYEETKRMPHERKQALHASQIMTFPVVSLLPETSMKDAWKLIRDRRFRHVPVVSKEKKLVGIISDRDLLREAVWIAKEGSGSTEESHKKRTIGEIMKRKVLAAGPGTEIREIARILIEERVGSMPIVSDRDQIVGIITRSDILRALIQHAQLELWI